MKQVYQEDIEFVDISIDEDKDKWQIFIDKHKPAGLQLITNNVDKTRRDLNISSLSLYYIVNENGEYNSFTSLDKAEKILSKPLSDIFAQGFSPKGLDLSNLLFLLYQSIF